jgi:hypothetical protein
MKKEGKDYLQLLLEGGEFRFARLDLPGIDNGPVILVNDPDIVDQETCLFHRSIDTGAAYLEGLHEVVRRGMAERRPTPVVRFADGEYAFYHLNLGCNGLYRQAESVAAIRRALPLHVAALRRLAAVGRLAPLVFPGNIVRRRKRGFLASVLGRSGEEPSAVSFLDFLRDGGVGLGGDNYLPFYAVYAYLTSAAFARLVDGRKLVILNSDFDEEACRAWFTRFLSRPELSFTKIPAEYIATRWEKMREDILGRILPDAEICLAGAGVGALPLCVDVADRLSIPVLDAGHVLNMMNAREDKSKGMRLYTLWKTAGPAASPAKGR